MHERGTRTESVLFPSPISLSPSLPRFQGIWGRGGEAWEARAPLPASSKGGFREGKFPLPPILCFFCATGIMPHSVLMRCRIFHRFASNCSSSLPFSERLPNTKKPNWLRTIGTEMMFSLLQSFPLFLRQPALTYFEMHHASLSKPKGTI